MTDGLCVQYMINPSPLPSGVRDWSKAVASRGVGIDHWASLCLLQNLLVREVRHHNFRYGRLNALHKLLEDVGQLYDLNRSRSPLELRKLVDQVIWRSERSAAPLHLEAKRTRRNSAKVSRVVTAGDLINYNLSPMLRKRYARRGLGIQNFVRDLKTNGRARDLIVQELTGSVRGKFSCAFVTKTRSLAGLSVDKALSMLGFAIVGNEHWVEIRYPQSFCSRGLLRTPTVLAAGDNPAFRSEQADSAGWGRTLDVDTLGAGLPEAVHDEYRILAGEGFVPVYLGNSSIRQFDTWRALFTYTRCHP